jgi:glycerol-3-phosphate dehydrogenase (NAD(P)+)
MMHIITLGGGVMASAFAIAQSEHNKVSMIPTPFDQQCVEKIQASAVDERLDIPWPSDIDFVQPNSAVDFDAIVIGVSSAGFTWATNIARQLLEIKKVPVILLTKGLVKTEKGIEPLSVAMERQLSITVLAITGPCIAKELAHKRMTHVEISSEDISLAQMWSKRLRLDYYFLHVNSDYIGCQWSAALKNVYAILIAKTGENLNLRSSIFSASIQEMGLWVKEQGGNPSSVYGLSGVGDLYVTCQGGRNGRFGHFLSEGLSIEAITSGPMQGITIEGLELATDLVDLPESQSKTIFQELASLL